MIVLRPYNGTIILNIRYKLTSIKVNTNTYVQLVFAKINFNFTVNMLFPCRRDT